MWWKRRGRWVRKYRENKILVKRLTRESTEKVDEDFDRKVSTKYQWNKKLLERN